MTALPHDLLIGFSDQSIERVATTMMALVERPRPRLSIIEAPLARHLFAFVWLARDSLSTAIRLHIQSLLEAGTAGIVIDWSLQVEGGNLALLRFMIDIREGHGEVDEAALDTQLQSMLRGWPEAVESELSQFEDYSRAAALTARFAGAFPLAYHADYGPAEAARDILRLRALQAGDPACRAGPGSAAVPAA